MSDVLFVIRDVLEAERPNAVLVIRNGIKRPKGMEAWTTRLVGS